MAGMVIQHNMNALGANNKMNVNVQGTKKATEKLSSGYQINRAGDNAAGLAISEKMRSQIRGLAQATKNANDGISMIQTYEGALQESHAILQRMKELASQSANGTYQTEVDRDAIQSEFKQLNDELDQIADTDFNGVTALNGGQMADGTKAVNGKFDYENGNRVAKQLGSADVGMLDYQQFDDQIPVANKGFTNADTAWNSLFGSIRDDNNPSNNGPEFFDATFSYDAASGGWSLVSATNGADTTKLSVVNGATAGMGAGTGGFRVGIGTPGSNAITDTLVMADLTIDESNLVNGDTITLRFNNPAAVTQAPANGTATIADSTLVGGAEPADTYGTVPKADAGDAATGTAGAKAVLGENDANLVVDVNESITMTQDIEDFFKLMENATVEGSYNASAKTAIGDMTIKFADPTQADIKVVDPDVNPTMTVGNTTFTFKNAADGYTVYLGNPDDDKKVMKLSMTQQTNEANGKGASGTVTWNINLAEHNYDNSKVPSVEIVEDKSKVSISNSNNGATAPLTYTDNITLQVGARTKDSVNFTFKYEAAGMGDLKANLNCSSRTDGLGTADLSLKNQKDANIAIDKISNAINKVSMIRANFGAMQNRLEHKVENLTTTNENLTAAESQIRDTDMATTMIDYTKNNILQQASQAMLAQANQQPQSVLQLLQ